MISVDEAVALVLDRATPLPPEEVELTAALGRVLRESIRSDLNMPPFPRSAVDGYALRAADIVKTPARLDVVGTIPAGVFPTFRVEAGQAAAIMTGAPVPDGADCVQMVEQSRSGVPEEGDGRDEVEILEPASPGQNIAPAGSEVEEGDVVLKSATRIDAAAIAVAATVGATRLRVGRRPRVAVAATGDELVPPERKPGPGQIRNSNGFSLVAQCRGAGIEARYLGVALDNEASLTEIIRDGLESDVLLLSGGVSMGRFDLVEDVLERFGVAKHIEAVRLKPGKPLVFGTTEGGKLVFGLPGNPVSTMVTFELFVRPALARLEGARQATRALGRARLAGRLKNRGERRAYLPGFVAFDAASGEAVARPVFTRGSGDIVAFAKGNALLVVPEDVDVIEADETIRFHPLDSFLDEKGPWDTTQTQTQTQTEEETSTDRAARS